MHNKQLYYMILLENNLKLISLKVFSLSQTVKISLAEFLDFYVAKSEIFSRQIKREKIEIWAEKEGQT